MRRRFTPRRTPVGLIVVTVLFPAFGCREQSPGPTGPDTEASSAAAAASAPLAFSQLSAGSHSCGVTTVNRAYCWGSNFTGELGDGTTRENEGPEPVVGPM